MIMLTLAHLFTNIGKPFKMSSHNNLRQSALLDMRLQFLESKQHIKHYRNLYSIQKRECSELKKQVESLNKQNASMQSRISTLQRIISNLNEEPPCNKSRKRKKRDSIKTEKTKRQRLGYYKEILFTCLSKIEKCHRAEISLWLDNNRIQFSWCPNDFKHDKTESEMQKSQQLFEHSYASAANEINENDEEYEDVNFSEIFDTRGNWKRSHIRSLIHVLDSFRISQEAYHELRMVSKGHLPPIHRLCMEKGKMSDEISYEKIPNVRFPFLLIILFYHGILWTIQINSTLTIFTIITFKWSHSAISSHVIVF